MNLNKYQPNKPHKWKDYKYPENFIVVIDTREQTPLFNPLPKGLLVVRDTLHNGDYSVRGFEDQLMIERKGISDLVPYLQADHQKTKAKLERCSGYRWKGLVIEAEEKDLYAPNLFHNCPPELMRQALCALSIRYNMHVYFSRSRQMCEMWVLDRLIKFVNVAREVA